MNLRLLGVVSVLAGLGLPGRLAGQAASAPWELGFGAKFEALVGNEWDATGGPAVEVLAGYRWNAISAVRLTVSVLAAKQSSIFIPDAGGLAPSTLADMEGRGPGFALTNVAVEFHHQPGRPERSYGSLLAARVSWTDAQVASGAGVGARLGMRVLTPAGQAIEFGVSGDAVNLSQPRRQRRWVSRGGLFFDIAFQLGT